MIRGFESTGVEEARELEPQPEPQLEPAPRRAPVTWVYRGHVIVSYFCYHLSDDLGCHNLHFTAFKKTHMLHDAFPVPLENRLHGSRCCRPPERLLLFGKPNTVWILGFR